LVKNR